MPTKVLTMRIIGQEVKEPQIVKMYIIETDDCTAQGGHWVTINGVHICIRQGEDAATAFKRTTGKDLGGQGAKEPTTTKEPKGKPQWTGAPDDNKIAEHPSGVSVIKLPQIKGQIADQAYVALDEVPSSHLEGLDRVSIYDTDRTKPAGAHAMLMGQYSEDQRSVTIYQDGVGKGAYANQRVNEVTKHEVAHHAWAKHLSAEQHIQWRVLYQNTRMPTGYAKTRDTEGFAECYMYYFAGKKAKLDPKIQDYFSQFEGGG